MLSCYVYRKYSYIHTPFLFSSWLLEFLTPKLLFCMFIYHHMIRSDSSWNNGLLIISWFSSGRWGHWFPDVIETGVCVWFQLQKPCELLTHRRPDPHRHLQRRWGTRLMLLDLCMSQWEFMTCLSVCSSSDSERAELDASVRASLHREQQRRPIVALASVWKRHRCHEILSR